MTVDSLRTHLLDELKDLRDAEDQLLKTLPKLAKSATAKPLKVAFRKHLAETRVQVQRLNQAFRELGEKPESKACKGMKGLISEGESVMRKTPEGALRDAVLITGAQKVEHYEMASYGTARTYAAVLGEARVANLLNQTLREEKAADLTLTKIAESTVNEDAADEWAANAEDGVLAQSAEWVGSSARSASRRVTKQIRRVLNGRRPRSRRTRRTRRGKRAAA